MISRKIRGAAAFMAALALAAAGGGVALAADNPGPAAGNIDPAKAGSITLTKYAGEPFGGPGDGTVVTPPAGSDNKPLPGVEFTAYTVKGLDVTDPANWEKIDVLNAWVVAKGEQGHWSANDTIGGSDVDYKGSTVSVPVYTLSKVSAQTTNDQGIASWGVGSPSTLPLGVYFLEETAAPATVAEHVLPFLVTVPTPHNAGTEQAPDYSWIYDVNVYPKNAILDVEKEPVDGGHQGVGSDISWTVSNTVPATQRPYDSYNLFDLLDSRLAYVAGSTVLTWTPKGGTAQALVGLENGKDQEPGKQYDYFVTYSPTPSAPSTDTPPARQSVRIDLTTAGLAKLNAGTQDGSIGGAFEWTFKTTVMDIGGGSVENTATVLPNQPGSGWGLGPNPPTTPPPPVTPPPPPTNPPPPTEPPPGPPSPTVYSNWGALNIFKFAGSSSQSAGQGPALSGATFQVFGSAEDAAACSKAVQASAGNTLPKGCENPIEVSRDLNGAAISPAQTMFTTDATGHVVIPGLATGVTSNPAKPTDSTERVYWLVEIVPPAGYINEAKVYEVNVVTGSVTDAVTLNVPNAQEPPPTLPLTGAAASAVLFVAAVALGAGALFLLAGARRKREAQK